MPPEAMIRVVLADDNLIVREGVRALIERHKDLRIVGVASDYFIRPRLVGSDKNVPVLLTFVSLFGGVEVFGLVGLVLGPVIVTLSIAILKTYQTEVSAARGAT